MLRAAPGCLALLLLVSSCRRPDPLQGWQGTAFQERRIYNACAAYSSVNGHLPATLEDLVPDFLPDRVSLGDPEHPECGEIGYLYFGSGSLGTEPHAVVLASKVERQGRRALVHFSGDGGIMPYKAAP